MSARRRRSERGVRNISDRAARDLAVPGSREHLLIAVPRDELAPELERGGSRRDPGGRRDARAPLIALPADEISGGDRAGRIVLADLAAYCGLADEACVD